MVAVAVAVGTGTCVAVGLGAGGEVGLGVAVGNGVFRGPVMGCVGTSVAGGGGERLRRDIVDRIAAVGRRAGKHLIEDDAERIDIGPLVGWSAGWPRSCSGAI